MKDTGGTHMTYKNIVENREDLIKARNRLSLVFNRNKGSWNKDKWMKSLCLIMGELDVCIQQLNKEIK